jgi:hypothetical protein
VNVKDLKRLYGQEKALTNRSMEMATKRKALDTETDRVTTSMAVMTQRAKEAFEPFSKIDYVQAQQNMDPKEFQFLQAQAHAAHQNYKFHTEELDAHMTTLETQKSETRAAQAKETLQRIADPADPVHIPDWNDQLYNDIRAYGVKTGIDQSEMDDLVDPIGINILWKAMQFDTVKKTAKVKLKKKAGASPKKVPKAKSAPSGKGPGNKAKSAMANLKANPDSAEAAAEAWAARWD